MKEKNFLLSHEKSMATAIVAVYIFSSARGEEETLPTPGLLREGAAALDKTGSRHTYPGLEGLNNVASRSHLCNQVDGVAGILRKSGEARSCSLFETVLLHVKPAVGRGSKVREGAVVSQLGMRMWRKGNVCGP